jgi:hypothetical protein
MSCLLASCTSLTVKHSERKPNESFDKPFEVRVLRRSESSESGVLTNVTFVTALCFGIPFVVPPYRSYAIHETVEYRWKGYEEWTTLVKASTGVVVRVCPDTNKLAIWGDHGLYLFDLTAMGAREIIELKPFRHWRATDHFDFFGGGSRFCFVAEDGGLNYRPFYVLDLKKRYRRDRRNPYRPPQASLSEVVALLEDEGFGTDARLRLTPVAHAAFGYSPWVRQVSSEEAVKRFQEQWLAMEIPKLADTRGYWNARVANGSNVHVSTLHSKSLSKKLTELEPEKVLQSRVFGSIHALKVVDVCEKVVVRGEGVDGYPQIEAYLDAYSGTLFLAFFHAEK